MNNLKQYPPIVVQCNKCGTRYVYEAPSCCSPGMLRPTSIRGYVRIIKMTLKDLLGKNKEGKSYIGFIKVHCPVFGEEIETPFKVMEFNIK